MDHVEWAFEEELNKGSQIQDQDMVQAQEAHG